MEKWGSTEENYQVEVETSEMNIEDSNLQNLSHV